MCVHISSSFAQEYHFALCALAFANANSTSAGCLTGSEVVDGPLPFDLSLARLARETAAHHLHHEPLFESPMTSFDLREDPLRIVASNPRFRADYPIFIRRGIGRITSASVRPGFDLMDEWFEVPGSTEFAEATNLALSGLAETHDETGVDVQSVSRHERLREEWMTALLEEIQRVLILNSERALAAFLSQVSLPPRSCVVEVESETEARIIWNGKTFGRGYGLYLQRPKSQIRALPYNRALDIVILLDSPWSYVLRVEELGALPQPHIEVGIFQDSTPVNQPRSDISITSWSQPYQIIAA